MQKDATIYLVDLLIRPIDSSSAGEILIVIIGVLSELHNYVYVDCRLITEEASKKRSPRRWGGTWDEQSGSRKSK
jgi:hypothetical protein